MPYFLKIINVALLASVKFFYAPLYAIALNLDYWGTLTGLTMGGILSFLGFYYATDLFLVYIKHLHPVIIKVTPNSTRLHYSNWKSRRKEKRKHKKIFTKRNRILVKIRGKWGMWGIIFCTPIILSIPFGAILLRRYYGHRQIVISATIFAILLEGFIIQNVYWYFIIGF